MLRKAPGPGKAPQFEGLRKPGARGRGAWTGIFNAKNGKNGEKLRSSRRKDGKCAVEAIQNTGVMGVHGIQKCSGELETLLVRKIHYRKISSKMAHVRFGTNQNNDSRMKIKVACTLYVALTPPFPFIKIEETSQSTLDPGP